MPSAFQSPGEVGNVSKATIQILQIRHTSVLVAIVVSNLVVSSGHCELQQRADELWRRGKGCGSVGGFASESQGAHHHTQHAHACARHGACMRVVQAACKGETVCAPSRDIADRAEVHNRVKAHARSSTHTMQTNTRVQCSAGVAQGRACKSKASARADDRTHAHTHTHKEGNVEEEKGAVLRI